MTSKTDSATRPAPSTVARLLEKQPYRFDFFQAVRLLRLFSRQNRLSQTGVGLDRAPSDEIIRFRALVSHRFPGAAIHSIESAKGTKLKNGKSSTVPEMVVSFAGVTGPSGVLPRHYTQLLIDRVRRKDYALRDFLDLFNHRFISLFYRAWEKYHFPIAYEDAAGDPDGAEEDVFTRSLYCLVGMGTGGLRNRLEISDKVLLYYGGLFAHFPRNAISLEAMVADYFDLPAQVLQFFGQWLYLSQENQTNMPRPDQREGGNNQLGFSAIVGERVWGVENKFRVRLGPLGYDQFRRFTPMGDRLVPLGDLVRTYAGPDFDFDVQPVLRRDEVPCARLGGNDADPSRLGWNTWVRSRTLPHDAQDAVFEFEGGLA